MGNKEVFKYLVFSFFLGLSLWIAVNFGERFPLTVIRFVEVKEGYRTEPELVEITLLVSRKLLESKLLEYVRAYVDERDLEEGKDKVRVKVYTPLPFLIEPSAVNPPFVRIRNE
ncbi:hypothetical protein [Aquifex sp.]